MLRFRDKATQCIVNLAKGRTSDFNINILVGMTGKPKGVSCKSSIFCHFPMHATKTAKIAAFAVPCYLQLAREEWSGTLWANLDIQVLTDGIEEFMKRLRKFPKEVKSLAVCHVLEERMREFKDSIPLFSDLKNDALRDRLCVWACSSACYIC